MRKRNRETIAGFAKRVGVSRRTIERDLAAGLPHATDGDGRVVIEPAAGLAWRKANRVSPASDVSSPLTDARTRRELAHARLEELKVWREEGVTIRVEEAERLVAASYARVAAKLNALASRLAPVVVGIESVEAAYAIVNRVVDEIREEIRTLADDDEPAG